MFSDIAFILSLVLCISMGSYYKKIDEIEMKRNFGAGLGVLVACMLCGDRVFHSVLLVLGNTIIIKCCDKGYVHQMSMTYTWLYLSYLHYNLTAWNYGIWMYQTMALRLVGLAFEVHLASKGTVVSKPSIGDSDYVFPEPTSVDIITYSYFFVGLHRGPYFRWKSLDEHFTACFGSLGDCRIITEHKLKKAMFCCLGFLILQRRFPLEMYDADEFYKIYSNELRYLYNIPTLMIFFLKLQTVMMLCTSVCTESGFGVYPAKCMPAPGHGPTAGGSLLKIAISTKDMALEQEYNFSMLKCYEKDRVLFGPRMMDTFRGWDKATRYWFHTYIYRQVNANKDIRKACTFAAWWIWMGPTLPHLMMSVTLWIYLELEREYIELIEGLGLPVVPLIFPWDVGFSLMRVFCLLYLTPCLVVEDSYAVFRYYNSIFWVYHFIMLIFVVVLALSNLLKRRRSTVS